jgi:LysM repeat protein
MKRIFFFLIALSLCGPAMRGGLRAQDAATEERLNKLNGLVQDLLEDKAHQRKQIESLSREVQSLREQVSKPAGNYATADDLRMLARKVQEIDQKRIEDNERIVKKIEKLGETLASPPLGKKSKPKSDPGDNPGAGGVTPEKGFEHTVASGDTLSTIAQAYKEKGIKVTVDQILKVNPGLVPEKMKVGQKIFIPGPPP